MPYPLQEKFNPEGPISQVPMEWFETVSKILNYLEGMGVTIHKSADPSEANPWKIEVPQEDESIYPAAHAVTHIGTAAGGDGSDPIRLDDLEEPEDNTDLDSSTDAHGLLPKLSDEPTEFLDGQGAWTNPALALLDGEGNGILVWNDGTDTLSTYVSLQADAWLWMTGEVTGASMLYGNAGTTPTVDAGRISWVMAQKMPVSGALAADMVLAVYDNGGTLEARWQENGGGLPGSPSQGDILYYNGSAWVSLGAGTSGQFLKTNGSGANPSWAWVATV